MSQSSSSGGIGFFGMLTTVFITLKLLHVINWSWWLVLAPTLVLTFLVLGFLIIGLVAIYVAASGRK